MAATKAIEFDEIVYGNNGPTGAKDRRYYKLNYRGAIPAGHRVFWCIGSRANFVDVTGGFTRRSLVALSGIYKKLQVWGGEVHTWLEASLVPQTDDYLESNPRWLLTPVRPYYGLMTTMGFRIDWTPFTYTKTQIGRLLEYEQFAGGRYFRYGSVLETDPKLRGMDCTTFPMALFDVSCDVTTNAGPNLALALGAGTAGNLEGVSRATLMANLFGLNGNKEFTGTPKEGLYLIWNGGHIFLYRGNAAHKTYGIHEFTGSGSDGTEWKAVGYKETSIVDRTFRNVSHWARKLPARYEPQVINTTDSLCQGVPTAESQVTIGTPPAAGGAGKPPASVGGNLYTVVSGDSLSVIAGRKWNDVLLWPILYDANKQVIGSNPNLIKPGQKLTVPSIAGYSASQLSATRERGRNWR